MKTAITLFAMISCTVAANLLTKIGSATHTDDRSVLFGFLGLHTLAGLGFFGLAFVFYAIILRWLPLNIAQSLASLQFVAVILAARLVLGETIGLIQWIGVGLIIAGVATIGWMRP
jgi:undecaprenyl phosphate-alpha-L-ara4N flippase subunit ArnE